MSSHLYASIPGYHGAGRGQDLPKLKVVTLNMWGIKYVSSHLNTRLTHLIDALRKNDYDIVALQEVWSKDHFRDLKEQLKDTFEYSFYFNSGLFGSGCCIFSKYFIEDVLSFKFSLNGYPHKFYHGDWFGGKLVGLAVLNYFNMKINVYITHLHANYSSKHVHDDDYLSHRLCQLFEMAQFINKTSTNAHASILMGDLNTIETETGYRLLCGHTKMKDAYKCISIKSSTLPQKGHTCYSMSNYYTGKLPPNSYYKDGIRIDYIMFKSRPDVKIVCNDCFCCLGSIPDSPDNLSFSDHEGVYAEFTITDHQEAHIESDDDEPLPIDNDTYLYTQEIISESLKSIPSCRLALLVVTITSLTLLCLFNNIHPVGALFKNILCLLLIFVSFVYGCIIKPIEKNHLDDCFCSLEIIINSLRIRQHQHHKVMAKSVSKNSLH